MSDIGFAVALRNDRLQQLLNRLDAAATPGKIQLYTAARPATGAAITDQILLSTVGLSKPAGVISNGMLTFAAFVEDPIADATGGMVWGRALDGDDNFVMDMGCSATGDPAPNTLIFNTLSVQAGGVVQILSGVIVEGNP